MRPGTAVVAVQPREGRLRPSTSIGSPRGVPVPCASTAVTVRGSTPASRSAATMTRACAAGFGAVSDGARPPWLTAVPRTTP